MSGALKAVVLLNVEPQFDARDGRAAVQCVAGAQMVVTLSPFKANMDCSDILLPISPFTETAGSFVNAEGRLQSFHAVVKPLGETRPAWKVLRVLANMMELSGFDQDSVTDVLAKALPGAVSGECISLPVAEGTTSLMSVDYSPATSKPCVASIYQLDGLVRRSPSLQDTADARDPGLLIGAGA
jgi:NADH-quinone oxidoreductase subunit G